MLPNIFYTIFSELEDVDVLEENYPLTELTSDYLNSSSSIRDFRSRVATIQFKLSTLFLDHTSRDKFLRLIGAERYDEETDLVMKNIFSCSALARGSFRNHFW